MKKNPNNLNITTQAGFSLVDVMVGMVIALLGVIIIFQVFSVSEGIKRTTTGGGEALQNGASALYTLERSLKEAGYGLFTTINKGALANTPPASAVPVAITVGGAANLSDSIQLIYRQNWDFGPFPPDPITFASAVPPALTVETFSVVVTNNIPQLVSNVNGVISDGIVLLKAEYGTDTTVPPDGVVDTWTQAAPANALSVLAVRLAVVTRSAQPEKPIAVGGACDTTTVFPTWIDSVNVPLDISGNVGLAAGVPATEWMCYRYKTFENTVPIRNAMWRP